ncbi:DUF1214 domain-containing protein [Nocardioides alcanivorans]|uniref:DUF1214 domain-containing protein n=1 Tax=Nocardioides alcanivorans TaxID=2897352 RepID=UPI001F288059|nr:DUF1214 domain-containing protein [Nocardioides alcanivorans]
METFDEPGITATFAAAVAEAEELIRTAPFIRTEQDLLEGYDYLSGRMRTAIAAAFSADPGRTLFVNATHQFARQGLDNPDTVYFQATIRDSETYLVRGRRGSTADLCFQVMAGAYTADKNPDALAAFDEREIEFEDDGTYEIRFGPELPEGTERPRNYFVSGAGATSLIVREVYNDWDTEERGTIWIERVGEFGEPRPALTREQMAKKYDLAAKMLTGSIRTWFVFPYQQFRDREPANSLTPAMSTPGGLTSQRSSLGHYDLAEDEALVVTVAECDDCTYQGFQIGSDWYVSTDYESHQTSLTKAQAQTDPDGKMRFVISEQDPGVANWLETLDHRTGYIMLRWQQLSRDLTPEEGPVAEKVKIADLPGCSRTTRPTGSPRRSTSSGSPRASAPWPAGCSPDGLTRPGGSPRRVSSRAGNPHRGELDDDAGLHVERHLVGDRIDHVGVFLAPRRATRLRLVALRDLAPQQRAAAAARLVAVDRGDHRAPGGAPRCSPSRRSVTMVPSLSSAGSSIATHR